MVQWHMARKNAHDRICDDMKTALAGGKLIFTPFSKADPEKFGTFMQADDKAFIRHCKWPTDRDYDPAYTIEFLHDHHRNHGAKFVFLIQEKPDGPYIGEATVLMKPGRRNASIGYFVLPSCEGRGVATGIATQLKEGLATHAGKFGIREVVAEVEEGNAASVRVLEKAGFQSRGLQLSDYDSHAGQTLQRFSHSIERQRGAGIG